MAIIVIKEKCRGCNLCVKACPFEAIDMVEKLAVINEKCTVCNQCVAACPFDAMYTEEKPAEKVDLSAYKDVWVYAEQRAGKIMNVALELIGEGRRLAREIGGSTKVWAALIGDKVEGLASECFEYGADGVYVIQHDLLARYTTDGYTKAFADLIAEKKA